MRRYELMLLFRPDLEDDKLQSAVEKVTRAIVNAGGTLTKVSPWGKRRMAYEIAHFREASYFLLHFDIAPTEIREIERGMLISEEILRHLVTVLVDHGPGSADDELVPAALSADAAAERQEAASVLAPAAVAQAADDEGTDAPEPLSDVPDAIGDAEAEAEAGAPEAGAEPEIDREEEEAGTAIGGRPSQEEAEA